MGCFCFVLCGVPQNKTLKQKKNVLIDQAFFLKLKSFIKNFIIGHHVLMEQVLDIPINNNKFRKRMYIAQNMLEGH